MISFSITAACCFTTSNPEARLREQQIIRQSGASALNRAVAIASGQVRRRLDVEEDKNFVDVTPALSLISNTDVLSAEKR